MTEMELSEYDRPLRRLLSEVIGTGPKSAEDMTREQSRVAIDHILDDRADPTTLGAFLLANRWKGNTPTELSSFVDGMRDRIILGQPTVDPVDCGANYDGKLRTAVLGIAAGILAATAGTPIVTHSGDLVPTKHGVTYKHVLDSLGIPTDLSPHESAEMVDSTGFGYYYQPNFNPAVHDLLHFREQMGVRTVFNTIETLANPANATVHLGSFYHLAFATRIADTLRDCSTQSFDRIVMIQGLEGYDEIRPGSTQVLTCIDDTVDDFTVETDRLGYDITETDLEVNHIKETSAKLTVEVLGGERMDLFTDAVILNAAVRIFAGGTVPFDEAITVAENTLDDGVAAKTLRDLQMFQPMADSDPGEP